MLGISRSPKDGRMSLIDFEGWNPPHMSYSTVSGWRDCGMRTKLQKVYQVEQRPGLAALGGNAVHTASELWDLGHYAQQVPPTAAELFTHAWDQEVEKRREQSPSYAVDDYIKTGRAGKEYGGKRNLDWWMDNGPGMVQAWIDWREAEGWHLWETPDGVPAIELELNVELEPGMVMKMFLDRVFVTRAGQIVVVDLKTGRTPETGEQLGLYACGMEIEYGQMFRPDFGYYWTPDKGHGSPILLERYTIDYMADIARQAASGINAGVFLAKPANNCANWCGVAKFCPAVGGSLPQS